MRYVMAFVALAVFNMSVLAADEFVLWSAVKSGKPGEVEWKKSAKVYRSEEQAYTEAAKVGKQAAVLEVRVLKTDRSAPEADSPIFAGRVATAPREPGISNAKKYTFQKDGTVAYESGKFKTTFKYTIDGGELWIAFVDNRNVVSDEVYKITKDGFEIVKSKERGKTDWYEFKAPLATENKLKFEK